MLPNYPHHVVQRGHNKQVVFAEPSDFRHYLEDLRELKTLFDVKVYAFCLMTSHVHLLLAPGDSIAGLGQLMKGLAGRMTRYRNKLEGRSGTLWESRYKSSVVQTDTYLLACSRYIELNPVRAQLVQHSQDYPWSSLHLRLNETSENHWLDEDLCFNGLGKTPDECLARYSSFMEQAIPSSELQLIRGALQRGQLTGNPRFTNEIEQVTGSRISHQTRGRVFETSRIQALRGRLNRSVPFPGPFSCDWLYEDLCSTTDLSRNDIKNCQILQLSQQEIPTTLNF